MQLAIIWRRGNERQTHSVELKGGSRQLQDMVRGRDPHPPHPNPMFIPAGPGQLRAAAPPWGDPAPHRRRRRREPGTVAG